jgi:hypothetical protein
VFSLSSVAVYLIDQKRDNILRRVTRIEVTAKPSTILLPSRLLIRNKLVVITIPKNIPNEEISF